MRMLRYATTLPTFMAMMHESTAHCPSRPKLCRARSSYDRLLVSWLLMSSRRMLSSAAASVTSTSRMASPSPQVLKQKGKPAGLDAQGEGVPGAAEAAEALEHFSGPGGRWPVDKGARHVPHQSCTCVAPSSTNQMADQRQQTAPEPPSRVLALTEHACAYNGRDKVQYWLLQQHGGHVERVGKCLLPGIACCSCNLWKPNPPPPTVPCWVQLGCLLCCMLS